MVDSEQPDGGLFPPRVGDRLRAAREAAGFDLNDIGTRTRIPTRHLEAIERGEFTALPSSTYAIGFVKSYARALDLDEAAFATAVRGELGRSEPLGRDTQFTELTDPARVPSRLLAGETAPAPTEAAAPVAAAPSSNTAVAATPAPASSSGQVTLTAIAPVWLRITDRNGGKLYEKEMAAGERFDVPKGAADPRILTGRPDALKVTIDGRDVAPLGPPERTVADLQISAAALAARPAVTAPVATPPVPVTQ
jgi:cytoskeleton protein RodZ